MSQVTVPETKGSRIFNIPDNDAGGKICLKYEASDPFKIGNKYGSIPANLLTNVAVWFVLMVLFFIVRKNIMGRLIKTTRHSLHWTQVFFRGRPPSPPLPSSPSSELSSPAPPLSLSPPLEDDHPEEDVALTDEEDPVSVSGVIMTEEGDNVVVDHLKPGTDPGHQEDDTGSRVLSLLGNVRVLALREKKLLAIMGPDAVQYLRFQKYITIYVFLTSLLSCGIILPLNMQGTQLGNTTDFGHTTLANLNPNNLDDGNILWVHVILGFIMFPIAIFMMRRFSYGLKMTDTNFKVTRTLGIENIPKILCKVDYLYQHFAEAYPAFPIQDIQIVHNVTKLTELRQQLENVVDSIKFCRKEKARQDSELSMLPVTCARCCGCFCLPCVRKVNSLQYFLTEEARLRDMILKEEEMARKSCLGMAFITFENINHARVVRGDHNVSILSLKRRAKESKLAMKPEKWRTWYAPPPRDIIWENLSNRHWHTSKKVIANIFIFFIAFFLTTPQYLVKQLEPLLDDLRNLTSHQRNIISNDSSSDPIINHIRYLPVWLTDILPTFLLMVFTWLLPVIIYYADFLVGHWTRSGQNHAVMKKTFWFLILMVIALPTFSFTSATLVVEFFVKDEALNWECIFLPDSGAFFVNYVITSAFIGTGLELIRFGDLFYYMLQVCISRSKADTPAIRKAIKYEFRFGDHYARMMLIFAMVIMFSMSCPLITPCGLLYFLFKHIVDRHNLAFVFARSNVNNKMHATAIRMVIVSVALLQVFTLIFSFVRSQDNFSLSLMDWRTRICLLLFVISVNVCSAQIWSNTCRKIAPIKYEDVMLLEHKNDGHTDVYLPPVLLDEKNTGVKSNDTSDN